ncbi:MAG TPA: L,D-transpeptidase family protein [Candidatus Acidoferrales bacterium]|jgi:murein L,D-transpeptidase YafK|nr:L,D-transpeptidase family protein [Candidatus Acidoferrales bacterium]
MAYLSQKKNKIIWISGILLIAGMSVGVASRLSAQGATKVDRIVIEKSKRTLTLTAGTKTLKTYKVALGGQPVGPKDRQGDHKTPEGVYSVDAKNPSSQFYKALHISYPNQADRTNARKLGVSPGGDVEIHGLGAKWGWIGAKHRLTDWTDGCIALTNEEIDEIYPLITVGTPVEIRP